jgi:hypothetical protein
MKSSLHSLIPILPHLPKYSAKCQLRRLSILFSAATAVSSHLSSRSSTLDCLLIWNPGTQLNSNFSCERCSLYSLGAAPTENIASSSVACWFTAAEMCLPHSCVATRAARTAENTAVLLLRAFPSAGVCLPSLCLAVNYFSFHASCHNIVWVHYTSYIHIKVLSVLTKWTLYTAKNDENKALKFCNFRLM